MFDCLSFGTEASLLVRHCGCEKVSGESLFEIFNVLTQLSELPLLEDNCDQGCKCKDDIRVHLLPFLLFRTSEA